MRDVQMITWRAQIISFTFISLRLISSRFYFICIYHSYRFNPMMDGIVEPVIHATHDGDDDDDDNGG